MRKLPDLVLLPALALACALVSSALAGPERRLAWFGRPLPAPPTPAAVPPGPAPALAAGTSVPAPRTAPAAPAAPNRTPAVASSAGPKPVVPAALAEETASSPYREMSSLEAWEAYRAGARFMDARRAADYRAGHVAGAWCTPVWESDLESRLTAFEAGSGASSGDPLVLYCGGGDCQDSHLLAGKLLAMGYRNLRIYRDGYPDWTAKGRPVRTGGDR